MKYLRSANLFAVTIAANCLAGCAALTGYPADANQETDLAAAEALSATNRINEYLDPQTTNREGYRNLFVHARIVAYDIEFEKFKQALNTEANLENLSGDVAVLVLNGLGATTGGATAKAALAAASAGVTGATAHVNKDLFFEKAIPMVLAQMEAGRAAQLSIIQQGLQKTDAEYPLLQAMHDLTLYRDAGSLPYALNALTASANENKQVAKCDLQAITTNTNTNCASAAASTQTPAPTAQAAAMAVRPAAGPRHAARFFARPRQLQTTRQVDPRLFRILP